VPDKIKILSPDVANKIAAGEVVERPASVVKELIENSLDAGSTEITVIVKDGGRELIQVVDNGAGMSRADAETAFLRHATSKISRAEDLEAIHSLGFRGEALASIASVSRVEMRTMEPETTAATLVRVEAGEITQVLESGGTPGTGIAVKNLFFNTPGRRKFLKAVATEYRHIMTTVYRFALGYPSRKFTLINEGEVIFEAPPQTLRERIVELYGDRLRDELIDVRDAGPTMELEGAIGKQSTVRQQRGEQFLFLNGRYIHDNSLNHAVTAAYGEILAHGGFPFYCLFLKIDPTRIDVNVHPTKMEVKFADDRLIYSIVRNAVRAMLSSAAVIPVAVDLAANAPVAQFETARLDRESRLEMPFSLTGEKSFRAPVPGRQLGLDLPRAPVAPEPHRAPASAATGSEQRGVWQLHNRYILSQIKSGLVVIDQHVAHERILYEQALAAFDKQAASTQHLLFPQVVELSGEDYAVLEEMAPFLEKIGFALRNFGSRTLLVTGAPSGLPMNVDAKFFRELIDDYQRGKRDNLEIRDNVARSYACHSAVRSGDVLSPEEMLHLIDELFTTKSPYFCPHGRPVVINIPIEELDKRFGRI
jgi:DNA mismatch repair protein MutL